MRLTLAGDCFIGPDFVQTEVDAIRNLLAGGAPIIVNFEGSLTGGQRTAKHTSLQMDESSVSYLPNAILSLANNHILDFGQEGLDRTVRAIEAAGNRWFGLESRRGAADNYDIVELGDLRICLAGFGWRNEECVEATRRKRGVVNFTRRNIDRTFSRLAKERYDFLLVYVHFGYEHEYLPLPLHVGLCRLLVDRGAHVVFGSHTHCVQPYEIHRGHPIFYGLGNFFFSHGRNHYPPASDRGLLVDLSLSKTKALVQIESVRSIVYSRSRPGFRIVHDDGYLKDELLCDSNLATYSANYRSIRHRKKNPRPILMFEQPFRNELKYRLWLWVVSLAGVLGIRQTLKRMLGWA